MTPVLIVLAVAAAPLPVARPQRPTSPPFQIGANIDATWRYNDQGPAHKWVCRFELDGSYCGYMEKLAYGGRWAWDGRQTLRVWEHRQRNGAPGPEMLYTITFDREGKGTSQNGAEIRMQGE